MTNAPMTIYDISPTLSAKSGVFPGDVAFRRTVSLSFEAGHHLGLSSIETTLHVGAHADAPSHYLADGASIANSSILYYVGRCHVARANVEPGARVGLQNLSDSLQRRINGREKLPGRFIVWTGTFPDPNAWNSDFASFDPLLIERLSECGVRLIGIDTPSIDPETSKVLESHKTVARLDLAVLEGLCLNGVAEGEYTLLAQPIKIAEGDAGLVRALLFDGDPSAGFENANVVECEKSR